MQIKKFTALILVSFLALSLVPYSSFAKGVQTDEEVHYYLYDHLGSIDAVLDEEGNVMYTPDRSLGIYTPEMDSEGLNSEMYTRRLKDLCRDVGEGRFQHQVLINEVSEQTKAMSTVVNYLAERAEGDRILAKNLATHVAVLKDISGAVRENTASSLELRDATKLFADTVHRMENLFKDVADLKSPPKEDFSALLDLDNKIS